MRHGSRRSHLPECVLVCMASRFSGGTFKAASDSVRADWACCSQVSTGYRTLRPTYPTIGRILLSEGHSPAFRERSLQGQLRVGVTVIPTRPCSTVLCISGRNGHVYQTMATTSRPERHRLRTPAGHSLQVMTAGQSHRERPSPIPPSANTEHLDEPPKPRNWARRFDRRAARKKSMKEIHLS